MKTEQEVVWTSCKPRRRRFKIITDYLNNY